MYVLQQSEVKQYIIVIKKITSNIFSKVVLQAVGQLLAFPEALSIVSVSLFCIRHCPLYMYH